MNFVGAFILLVAGLDPDEEENCFWFFVCLMTTYELKGFYREKFPMLQRYTQAFDLLVERKLPSVAQHFRDHQVSTSMFVHQWYLTLFVSSLPLCATAMLWDYFLATGTNGILIGAFSIIQTVNSAILPRKDMEDIIQYIRKLKYAPPPGNVAIGVILLKNARKADHNQDLRIDQDIQSIINVSSAVLDADVLVEEESNLVRQQTNKIVKR
eukprot:GHVH01008183.1.p1 GENE.GHVH01008183.1~~GHVH01008183.1.p1  ORF type:complete len:211 (+),score=29.54 GHVH01008183.1:654-1286(+)